MSRRARILFVDDEPHRMLNYAEYLRLDGFEVHTCSDIDDLSNYLSRRKYDIVVLDIIMPAKSNTFANESVEHLEIELRAGLLKGGRVLKGKSIPVIILSNLPLERIKAEDLIGLDVVDKLYKPLTAPSALAESITRNLDR